MTEFISQCADLTDYERISAEREGAGDRLALFLRLVSEGYKEIHIGCPAASEQEYAFCRRLISDGMVPPDVTVRVDAPPGPEMIRKTFEAIDGLPGAVVRFVSLPSEIPDAGFIHTARVMWSGNMPGVSEASRLLRAKYGLSIPENMQAELEAAVAEDSQLSAAAMTPELVYRVFEDRYVNPRPVFQVHECHFRQENGIIVDVTLNNGENVQTVTGAGNGRLDAVSNAIKNFFGISYELRFYEEHSLARGSSSKAVAYVGVVCNGRRYWGAGINNDIIRASIEALEVAVNKISEMQGIHAVRDKRVIEMMNFIQANYLTVTLESMSEQFYLSKPYLSKYIKEKSGVTFGEQVKRVRMKKARTLLKTSAMTVESIALSVGYQNVEHFNRLFKKAYHMTPVQFRNQS